MTATKTDTYTMAQLRAHEGSLFIRNNTGFLWTLHEKVGDGHRVDLELKPVTQPDSITHLPAEALNAPGIARNLAKGAITVSPDLEDEMVALMGDGATTSKNLLDQFQISVEESPQARAIDVKDQMNDNLSRVERKRITPQGQQAAQSAVDEFISPKPFKVQDGRLFDPATNSFVAEAPAEATPTAEDTGIKSVTVTAPTKETP